jgi:hypothetical protein
MPSGKEKVENVKYLSDRAHAKIAKEEKEKLLFSLKNVENVPEGTLNNIINAIQARQDNTIRRAQYVAV